MGKLTLLLVSAAILGGSLLTFSTRRFASGSETGTRSQQADLLSRQIAESGHSVILASIVGDTGFKAPAISTRSYEGGTYRVQYDPSSTSSRATFTVSGEFAGTTHTIKSTYEWDPMGYPGPIWLDVPYATATTASGAVIDGGPQQPSRCSSTVASTTLWASPASHLSARWRPHSGSAVRAAGGAYQAGRSAGSWNGPSRRPQRQRCRGPLPDRPREDA